MLKRFTCAILFLFAACSTVGAPHPLLIIKLNDPSLETLQQRLPEFSALVGSELRIKNAVNNGAYALELLASPPDLNLLELCQKLAQQSGVLYAEPDKKMRIQDSVEQPASKPLRSLRLQ